MHAPFLTFCTFRSTAPLTPADAKAREQGHRTEVEGQTVIRLNLMGNEGGELEQAFTLPVGSGLESATWSAGELHLRLN